MAVNFNLAPNESIILKEISVAHGQHATGYTDELILTNLNIICISKSVFGYTKRIYYYPLSQLKQYNGKPQAIIGNLSTGIKTLELYFLDKTEVFRFQTGNKKKINKWISEISAILGCKIASDQTNDIVSDSVAGAINEVGKQFKEVGNDFLNVFGIKSKKKIATIDTSKESTIVNKKCLSCSAPLVGKRGTVVQCKYCDTEQTL